MQSYPKERNFSRSDVLFVVLIVGIVAAVSIPTLIASRSAGNEKKTIAVLRAIHSAQTEHRAKAGQNKTYASFDELPDEPFASGNAVRNNYRFGASVNAAATAYCVKASPADAAAKYFGINEKGVVYQSGEPNAIDCAAGILTLGGDARPVY